MRRLILGALGALLFGGQALAGPPAIPQSAPVSPVHPGAAYAFEQKAASCTQTATALIDGDSTSADGNTTGSPYFIDKWAVLEGLKYPCDTVYYYTISGSSWSVPTVLQQGTGSGIIRVYNGAVAGTQEWYFYGSTFYNLYVSGLASPPDLIIWNHDKNHDYTQPIDVLAAMKVAAVAQLSNSYPDAGIILIKENPDPLDYGTDGVGVAWTAGMAVTVGEKVQYGTNVYSAGSTGTAGATPPTCVSGTCSDGNITWTYVAPAVSAYWSAGMAVTSGQKVQSGGNAYQAGSSGTAGSTAPGCTTGTCSDGNITWTYLGVAQQMDNKVRATQQAAALLGAEVVDNYNLFMKAGLAANMASGNPGSWFTYTVHQTQAADTLMAANLEAATSNLTAPLPHKNPLLDVAPNLLANPKFQAPVSVTWSAGLAVTSGETVQAGSNFYAAGSAGTTGSTQPTCTTGTCSDGNITWTYIGSYFPASWVPSNVLGSQYTTSYENGGSYALKLLNAGAGQSSISQTLSGAAIKSLVGKKVTLAARVQLIDTSDTSSCALQITSNAGRSYRTYAMSASGSYTGGYMWFATTATLVSSSDTQVVFTIYPTYNAGTAAGKGCIIDRVWAGPGALPHDTQ